MTLGGSMPMPANGGSSGDAGGEAGGVDGASGFDGGTNGGGDGEHGGGESGEGGRGGSGAGSGGAGEGYDGGEGKSGGEGGGEGQAVLHAFHGGVSPRKVSIWQHTRRASRRKTRDGVTCVSSSKPVAAVIRSFSALTLVAPCTVFPPAAL